VSENTNELCRFLGWNALSSSEQDHHIREGIADDEAGRTISHDDVKKWVREMAVRAHHRADRS
jgi:predicted transcriptional regulator